LDERVPPRTEVLECHRRVGLWWSRDEDCLHGRRELDRRFSTPGLGAEQATYALCAPPVAVVAAPHPHEPETPQVPEHGSVKLERDFATADDVDRDQARRAANYA